MLNRLAPSTVYVFGGTDRIFETTLAAITAAAAPTAAPGASPSASPTVSVQRIAGTDRYDTAVQIANKFFPQADGVVLTRGDTFPDALSGGSTAAAAGIPLMITEPTQIPASVNTWLTNKTFEASLIVGGTTRSATASPPPSAPKPPT